MITDPVERVARAIQDCFDADAHDLAAAAATTAVYNWLTEQGIPISELLSGEMVAVPKKLTPEMREAMIGFRGLDWAWKQGWEMALKGRREEKGL
jgi:hypothetical protein